MPTLQGVDRAGTIDSGFISTAKSNGAQFIGGYLYNTDDPRGQQTLNLNSSVVSAIHNAGLNVVSIACFPSATDETQWNYNQGVADATDAANFANDYGTAIDVIYIDIEGTTSANPNLVSYLEGFHYGLANTVPGVVFRLGVYSNPSNVHYLQGSSVASEVATWWVAAYNNYGPWYSQPFTGSCNLWQYASTTINGYSLDKNEIMNSAYGGW